jgi:hypothetical protein
LLSYEYADGFDSASVTSDQKPNGEVMSMPWNNMQLERMGDGLDPNLSLTGEAAFAAFVELEGKDIRALLERRGRCAA